MQSDAQGKGEITLIIGPMFSGKTTELMRNIKRNELAGRSCIVVNFAGDDRYTSSNVIQTHDGSTLCADKTENLDDSVLSKSMKYDVIGIDEGQFFPNLSEFCQQLASVHKKTVFVACLNGRFDKKPWDSVSNIIPICEHITHLKAVCKGCPYDAIYSSRIDSSDNKTIVIGNDYIAQCRKCAKSD
jgi:thymidine kinase